MDIGKSCKQAMFDSEMRAKQVADKMGCGIDRVYQLRRTRISASCDSLERLAAAFDMSVSEFVALGEK